MVLFNTQRGYNQNILVNDLLRLLQIYTHSRQAVIESKVYNLKMLPVENTSVIPVTCIN